MLRQKLISGQQSEKEYEMNDVCDHWEKDLDPNRNPLHEMILKSPLWLRNRFDPWVAKHVEIKGRL